MAPLVLRGSVGRNLRSGARFGSARGQPGRSYVHAWGASLGPHPFAQLPLRRFLYKVESQQGKGDEDQVADPWIESRQANAVEDVGVVDEVPEVEVEQVKAVAGLAYKDERADAEGAGHDVVAGEANDDAPEERHQQAVVDDGVGNVGAEPKQEEDGCEAARAKEKTKLGARGNP